MTEKPAPSTTVLDRVRDVPDAVADDRLGDPRGERVLRDVEQPLILRLDLPDAERVRAVGDVAVERDADVDRDEVALADDERVRDAVDDDVVRRDADRLRIALVALGGRDATVLADERACGGVELVGRHARAQQAADVGDRLGDERTRRGHLLDLARALADDHRLAATPSSASWIAAKTVVHRLLPVHDHLDARELVAIDHELGELVVETEPVADRLGRVVRPTLRARARLEPALVATSSET